MNAELPLTHRIREEIEGLILSGAWSPGQKIPSEAELVARYGCSRMTVSKALSTLAAAGLLDRRKGAGSRVARPRAQSMVLDVPDLAAEVTMGGHAYAWRLLGRGLVDATRRQAETLGTSGTILSIEGVHLSDERPLAYERRLVNCVAIPDAADADFQASAPGTWLLGHVPWTEAENRISAIAAATVVAERLGIDAGAPCLAVSRRTWRGDDWITQVEQYFVADRYELVARFGASDKRSGKTSRQPLMPHPSR